MARTGNYRVGITVHPQAHPLVHLLFDRMKAQRITLLEMEHRAGVTDGTAAQWAKNPARRVTLSSLEACLQVVGVEIVAKVPVA